MNFKKHLPNIIFILLTLLFFAASYVFEITEGKKIASLSTDFFVEVLPVLPVIFLLIGLFEIWVKRSLIVRHLGEQSSNVFVKYSFAVALASLNVGGMALAFPVGYALRKKGADMKVILVYLGASGLVRINMILFEASFLGFKFTIIRLLSAFPLIIIAAYILQNKFQKDC